MFVIDVIPFSRSAPSGALSYRSRERLAIGSIVVVPLRRKEVPGIVVSCTTVRDAKTTLKRASFVLRTGNARSTGRLPASYRATAEAFAQHHAISLSTAFRALIPDVLLTSPFPTRLPHGPGNTVTTCEAPYTKRIETYRAYVTEHAGSVLFVASTNIEVARLAQAFPKAVRITGDGTPARRTKAIAAARHASIVIATPAYALTPIEQLAHIVIERESAAGYVSVAAPYLDTRIAIRAFAHARNIPLTLGDYPLRIEARPQPGAPLAYASHTPITVLDVREKKTDQPRTNTFNVIPDAIQHTFAKTLAAHGRIVVIAVRKGYAPSVVCRDCGTSVRDKEGRVLSLMTTSTGRVFRNADGTSTKDAQILCDVCGSWNLLPLGIGVERVAESLAGLFPDVPRIRFDADTIKTPTAARHAIHTWQESSAILIGTEAVLPWLDPHTPAALSAIISADALLALPFWRARERFARLALTLANASSTLLIATRRPDDTLLRALTTPDLAPFFTEEAALRRTLRYPPYGHLLTIRLTGTLEQLARDEAYVRAVLAPHILIHTTERAATATRTTRTLVTKISYDAWPDATRARQLATLPPHITVTIDSETLW